MAQRLRAKDFADWSSYYREYQRRLTVEYLLPRLRKWGSWPPRPRILDVGCGDGGAALALAQAGAEVDGIDIRPHLVAAATEQARELGLSLRLDTADITDGSTLEDFPGPYDLVLFRDVLEHIPAREAALRNAAERLAPDGAIVVVFPPYLSAYGGHQQILHPRRILGMAPARLPWAHCLPRGLFHRLARRGDGRDDPQWEEIETIASARLTLSALEASLRRVGLRVKRREDFLLRPSFRLRWGLPVVGAGWVAAIPGLREIAVTASYQLLEDTGARSPGTVSRSSDTASRSPGTGSQRT